MKINQEVKNGKCKLRKKVKKDDVGRLGKKLENEITLVNMMLIKSSKYQI